MKVQVLDLINEFKTRINGNNHSKGGKPRGYEKVRRVDQQKESKPKSKSKKGNQQEEVQPEEVQPEDIEQEEVKQEESIKP